MVTRVTLKGEDLVTPILNKAGAGLLSLDAKGKKLSTTLDSVSAGLEGVTAGLLASVGVPPQLGSAIAKLTTKFTIVGMAVEGISKVVKRHEERMAKLREGYEKLKALPSKILAGIKEAWEKITTAIKKAFDSVVAFFKKTIEGISTFVKKASDNLSAFFKNTLSNLANLTIVLFGLDKVLDSVLTRLDDFVGSAAELEGVNAAFLQIAGSGATALVEQLRESSLGMIKLIDLQKAYNRAYLSMGRAVADRISEALPFISKIALATGEDYKYLLESLITGASKLSPKILDNLQLQITQIDITKRATDMFGKQADALLRVELQTAAFDLALEGLAERTLGLGDATGTLTHLQAIYRTQMADNAAMLGTHFLPVAKSFYKLLNLVAKATGENISKGGKWYNTLRKISAGLSVVIDMVADFSKSITGTAGDAIDKFADKMFNAAFNAFSWGANIVTNFAIGMTRAVSTVLIKAINYISNILSYWMSPGSPPKFLPNLIAWGSEAFSQFLHGFTLADFGVLSALQSPLMGALRNLMNLGVIEEGDVGNIFADLTESMAAALEHFRETGEISVTVLEKLRSVAGGYGAELEDLFLLQMQLAGATQDQADAEQRLADARKAEEVSGKALSKQAREYNKMLREGASEEALRAKMAEIRASYENLENAREASELAESDLDTARERAEEANHLARLQAELLQQLIDMARLREEAAGAGDGEDWDLPPSPFEDMIPAIDKAFEDLKGRIRARFEELWAELKADWDASGVGMLINDLKAKWEASNLKMWFEEFILDVREAGIKVALDRLWKKLAPTIQGWLDDKDSWWAEVWRAFTQDGIEDGSGKVNFAKAFTKIWTKLSSDYQKMLDNNGSWFADVWRAFTKGGIDDGSGKVSFRDAFDALWTKLKEGLNKLMFDFGEWLGRLVTGKLGSTKKEGESLGKSFVDGLIAGLWEREPWWITALRSFIDGFVLMFKLKLGIHSESTVFKEIGRNMMQGLISGFSSLADGIKTVLNNIIWVFERAINTIIDGFNYLLNAVDRLPGGSWVPPISRVYLPRLAEGGMIKTNEQLALLHANEVVLPLDSPETRSVLRQAISEAMGGRGGGQQVMVVNHFNKDSVRSSRDIKVLADAIGKSVRLSGVKVAM